MKHKSSESIKYKPSDYIDQILIPDIEKVKDVSPFFCFAIISCEIETLGSFYDDIVEYQPRLPYNRFKKGMALFDKKYKPLIHDLYYGLRCGFAHSGRPSKKIALTTKAELKAGDNHLKNIGTQGGDYCTLLVLEDFINHFNQACDKFKTDLRDNTKVNESKANKTYVTTIGNANGMYSGGTLSHSVHVKKK